MEHTKTHTQKHENSKNTKTGETKAKKKKKTLLHLHVHRTRHNDPLCPSTGFLDKINNTNKIRNHPLENLHTYHLSPTPQMQKPCALGTTLFLTNKRRNPFIL